MKKSLISVAIAMAVMAGSAHAERALLRNSLSIDRTHTNLTGGISARHLQQSVTADGFTRNVVKTAPNGATATRDTTVVNDVAAGTHTRTVNGTTLDGAVYSGTAVTRKTEDGFTRSVDKVLPNGKTLSQDMTVVNDAEAGIHTRTVSGVTASGKTYSGESVLQKTDDGVSHVSSFTGVNGNTSTRSADISVDQESGTLTKNISATGPRGQTLSTTVVRQGGSVESSGEVSVK